MPKTFDGMKKMSLDVVDDYGREVLGRFVAFIFLDLPPKKI